MRHLLYRSTALLLNCNILADFGVELVEKFDVDPIYLEPVFVAECSTTVVRHLCPVDAHFHVDFCPVAVHAVCEALVERLQNTTNGR